MLVENANEPDKMHGNCINNIYVRLKKKSSSLPDLPYSLRPPAKLRMPKMGGGKKKEKKAKQKQKDDSLVEKQCIFKASKM